MNIFKQSISINIIALSLFMFSGVLSAYSQDASIKKADSIVIDRNGETLIQGAIEYGLGDNGRFTGRLSKGKPAGPVIIYVFMEIGDSYKETIAGAGMKVAEYSAYVLPDSAEYSVEGLRGMKFLRSVDPDLSNQEIAAMFGVIQSESTNEDSTVYSVEEVDYKPRQVEKTLVDLADLVEKGKAAYGANRFEEALKLFRQAAENGDPEAQAWLGEIYLLGHGTQKNYQEAIRLYRLAAEQGNAQGQTNLGFMYQQGHGVAQNYQEAVRLYRMAAEQGYASAQNSLGVLYDDGLGVTEDPQEAFRLFRLAADQGLVAAQTNVGYMYRYGRGVKQDYQEAVRLYRLASEGGDAQGQNNLGYMYDVGVGVKQNYKEAARLYRLAADQGNYMAQNNLGRLYENGFGVKRDYEEAVRLYRLAAKQGYQYSIENLRRLGEL